MPDFSTEELIKKQQQDIEAFGRDAEQMLKRLTDELRSDFVSNLDTILANDFGKFQAQVSRTIVDSGLDILSPGLEGFSNKVFGNNVFATQLSSSLSGVGSSLLNKTIGKVFGGKKTRTSSKESERSVAFAKLLDESKKRAQRTGRFQPSRGQEQAVSLQGVQQGQRNL